MIEQISFVFELLADGWQWSETERHTLTAPYDDALTVYIDPDTREAFLSPALVAALGHQLDEEAGAVPN